MIKYTRAVNTTARVLFCAAAIAAEWRYNSEKITFNNMHPYLCLAFFSECKCIRTN